ncbi:MAG: secretin N-terminal domain-containing protein [Kiritimatiellia bacterium]|jgi:type IV pilus assembly protein PilQ
MLKNTSCRNAAGLTALCAVLLAGCATPTLEEPVYDSALFSAEAALERGDLTQAMIECIDIAREDPHRPGLQALQARILAALAEQRAEAARLRESPTQAAMVAEHDLATSLPYTYRLRQHVRGLDGSFESLPNEMQEILARPVSIHLVDVGLADIVTQIGTAENVNIVTDGALADGATLTIHVDDVPLSEVLEYVGRNLDVTFSVGRNIIWVTAGNASAGGPPMVTRIYRLRRGVTAAELGFKFEESTSGASNGIADAELDEHNALGTITVMDAIQTFVPELEGTAIVYNRKTNALLVKNTRENLALIEDIIDALDVRPPQVLIEARFLSTSVEDLRELGIDWVLNSAIGITKGGILVNGTPFEVNETQIDATMRWTKFANQSSGLNGSFTGILTDPMFRATLHALETYGNARTLSMPRVTAINNSKAHIRVGEDFLYYEDYDLEDYDAVINTGSGNSETVTRSRMVPSGSPTREELGISLTAVPSVGADMASIDILLAPSIREFVRWEYFLAANDNANISDGSITNEASILKLPVFRVNEIETEVVVRSGETVVMGGLMESTRQKTTEGVPFFSKLPFLGQLFRHDVWEERRKNLIVFVTATVVADTGEDLLPLVTPPVIDLPEQVELGEPPSLEAQEPPATEAAPAEAPAEAAP